MSERSVCERTGVFLVSPVLSGEEVCHPVLEQLLGLRDVPDQVLWEQEENETRSRLALNIYRHQVFLFPKIGCCNNDESLTLILF